MKLPYLFSLAVILLCGCSKSAKTSEETDVVAQVQLLRDKVQPALLVEATNEVPGIRSIVEVKTFVDGDAIVKWGGVVVVDYINHAGGVDRTNLQMKILGNTEWISAIRDFDFYQREFETNLAAQERKAGFTHTILDLHSNNATAAH